jgi:hypothetical protein
LIVTVQSYAPDNYSIGTIWHAKRHTAGVFPQGFEIASLSTAGKPHPNVLGTEDGLCHH